MDLPGDTINSESLSFNLSEIYEMSRLAYLSAMRAETDDDPVTGSSLSQIYMGIYAKLQKRLPVKKRSLLAKELSDMCALTEKKPCWTACNCPNKAPGILATMA